MKDENPYKLPKPLLTVWQILGRPRLHDANPWLGKVTITPDIAEKLDPFLRSRNGDGTFSQININDHAETMLRGQWIDYTDPIQISFSAFVIQGNHRIKAVARSKTTQRFNVTLGVPDTAERHLGKVQAWTRAQRLAIDKRLTGIANLGVRKELFGNLDASIGRGFDNEILLWAKIYEDKASEVTAVILPGMPRVGRAGVLLALMEGMIVDERLNRSTRIVHEFIRVMIGTEIDGTKSPFGSLQKDYLFNTPWATKSKDKQGQKQQARDYHCTVYNLKRAILKAPYSVDSRNRKPDAVSSTALWSDASGGRSVQIFLDNFTESRLRHVYDEDSDLVNSARMFTQLKQALDLPVE